MSQDPNTSPAVSLTVDATAWQRAHRFSHQAMATSFEILIAGNDRTYAAQAATEAFACCDRLESLLSRYREQSDIVRLNRAPLQSSVLLSQETFACLEQAARLFTLTQGAFDVTLGRWTADRAPAGAPAGRPLFGIQLDADKWTAIRLQDDVQVDLGGIGKGFALDRMADCLRQWGVTRALLHGGGSTVVALDGPEPDTDWPVTIRHPLTETTVLHRVPLSRCALASSAQIDRKHILDPHTGLPVTDRLAAWALAPNGTLADGLSTAFMILAPERIAALCAEYSGWAGLVVSRNSQGTVPSTYVQTWGAWSV
jgi:thiamine biosynthesis lipoprotein